ncbi:MAG: hypothetical protein BSOLF_2582 [Candidatus Carbobacillus altaicus]|uniref:Pilus assembly protein n=1 Tax=Candidatus Carbonibacillus altaicus TaxID=2163959 RepID=A0A2R6XXY6_9BACL|nr:MAG: hypothetical protein BSOLF_2582 [Candidatus Carbobacillus altaicus]
MIKDKKGGATLEFALTSIIPVAIMIVIYMVVVIFGAIKATDEAAREAARTYARYYFIDNVQAQNLARESAKNAFLVKAPPGSTFVTSNVKFYQSNGVISTYQNMTVSVETRVPVPFIGERSFIRSYTFPLESYKRKESLW